MRRLGEHLGRSLDPAACVAIEDTPTGVASAAGAGLRVVGLAPATEHGLERADRVVTSLEDVDGERLEALLG